MEKCSISHELMSKKLNEEEKKMNEESLKFWCRKQQQKAKR